MRKLILLSIFTLIFNQSFGQLSATISGTDPMCNGDCTGSASVVAANGVPGYTYLWNDSTSQTTDTASGLCAGTYVVTVTDALASTVTKAINLIDPPLLIASIIAKTNASCEVCWDGAMTGEGTGGTPGYTYFWDVACLFNPGQTTNLAGESECCIYVMDANFCIDTACGSVGFPVSISELDKEASPNIYVRRYEITVDANNGSAAIYNLMGKEIQKTRLTGTQTRLRVSNSGIYLVKVISEGKQFTRKLYLPSN
ncbi:MAG: T9SS type A sorting domain-containing protein [Bacteroidetes bacterium]|nr:T9SS type A sorting domain-containing protein [Bacteroidota bacterium]